MRTSDVSRMPTLAVVSYSDALGAISAFLCVSAVKWLSHVLPLRRRGTQSRRRETRPDTVQITTPHTLAGSLMGRRVSEPTKG